MSVCCGLCFASWEQHVEEALNNLYSWECVLTLFVWLSFAARFVSLLQGQAPAYLHPLHGHGCVCDCDQR